MFDCGKHFRYKKWFSFKRDEVDLKPGIIFSSKISNIPPDSADVSQNIDSSNKSLLYKHKDEVITCKVSNINQRKQRRV